MTSRAVFPLQSMTTSEDEAGGGGAGSLSGAGCWARILRTVSSSWALSQGFDISRSSRSWVCSTMSAVSGKPLRMMHAVSGE